MTYLNVVNIKMSWPTLHLLFTSEIKIQQYWHNNNNNVTVILKLTKLLIYDFEKQNTFSCDNNKAPFFFIYTTINLMPHF